jgi:spore maturation protein CgeB
MRILYSYNKRGSEAEFWQREIAAASDDRFTFIPFNHDPFVDPGHYLRAQALDDLYFDCKTDLMRLYDEVKRTITAESIDALFVDNCAPYHPDWLRTLGVFKVLRISDGPIAAYDRDFAYAHAYDLVLYHSPAYSRDMGIAEKLRYLKVEASAFLPLGVFDEAFSPGLSEEALFARERDIDVIFIGAMHLGKMPFLAKVKKALGRRCRMHGLTSLKRNLYFNAKHGFPGWIRPIPQADYPVLYQRAKIGFNLHNRGKYTVGSYRLFELPANGVMQISDGDEHLGAFFVEGDEVVGYRDADDLIAKIEHYLKNDAERLRIARNGYRRTMRDYRVADVLRRAGSLIGDAMRQRRPV